MRTARLTALLLTLLAVLCAPDPAACRDPRGVDRPLVKVRLQLKWRHQFQFAGYYAAVAQGYFRDEGLEVELLPAKPGMKPSDLLISGEVDYAVMSPAVLLERQQGRPLVVLGAIYQHSGTAILATQESGIRTPRDLRGKRIMLTEEADPENRAMLINDGVPPETLQLLPHSWELDDLITGTAQIDDNKAADAGFILQNQNFFHKLLLLCR